MVINGVNMPLSQSDGPQILQRILPPPTPVLNNARDNARDHGSPPPCCATSCGVGRWVPNPDEEREPRGLSLPPVEPTRTGEESTPALHHDGESFPSQSVWGRKE